VYNRYVDGLGAWTPDDREGYRQLAKQLVEHGYGNQPAAAAPPARG